MDVYVSVDHLRRKTQRSSDVTFRTEKGLRVEYSRSNPWRWALRHQANAAWSWYSLELKAPLLFAMLLTGSAPLLWLVGMPGRRRRRAIEQDRCISCGYDMHASGNRCPECGLEKVGEQTSGTTERKQG
jgi:predicted RNA-binding Zn-ribbon protein involved in translation (DUF1610 family)